MGNPYRTSRGSGKGRPSRQPIPFAVRERDGYPAGHIMSYDPKDRVPSMSAVDVEVGARWYVTEIRETEDTHLIPRKSREEQLRLGIFKPQIEVTMVPTRQLMKPLAADGWKVDDKAPALTRVAVSERVWVDPANHNLGTKVVKGVYFVQGKLTRVNNPSVKVITPNTLMIKGKPEQLESITRGLKRTEHYTKQTRQQGETLLPEGLTYGMRVETVTVYDEDPTL